MPETDQTRRNAWDESYSRQENYVFYPCDEVVRFVARYLRRRVGLDEVVDVTPQAAGSRIIDVGCGVGRNLVFGFEMGLDMHGIDLSANAVAVARDWLTQRGATGANEKVVAGDIRSLPWPDGYFAHAVSDSVLDSMPFALATAGVAEIARVVGSGGYFYCNLISGDESGRAPDFAGEETVRGVHERDTIQSYFNQAKIATLLGDTFDVLSCVQHRWVDAIRQTHGGRWHVVARRK